MSKSVATLSMYDWPETRAVLDRLWENIAREVNECRLPAPSNLHHQETQMELWTDPGLLLGQTCGWPYANLLRGKVIPFARFDYGLDGVPPGYYRSVFIIPSDRSNPAKFDQQFIISSDRIAVNGSDSQSGFHVFREFGGEAVSKHVHSKMIVTGAHRESVKAVADGKADLAAIDAVAFELAKKHESEAISRVRVVGHSQPKPGLPLITSLSNSNDAHLLFSAIETAVRLLSPEDRSALMIQGVLAATDDEYEVFLD